MAASMSLPPWLNLNPLEGVPLYLQGFGQGERAGASIREGELAQQKESSVESELERDRQERAAKAARQFSGMMKYQQAIADKKPSHEALIAAAPDMFYENPAAFATALNREEIQNVNRARLAEKSANDLEMRKRDLERLAQAAQNEKDKVELTKAATEAKTQRDTVLKDWRAAQITIKALTQHRLDLKDQMGSLSTELKAVNAELFSTTDPERKQTLKERAREITDEMVTVRKSKKDESEKSVPKVQSAQTIALPDKKTDMKVGQVYQTAKGPRRWDGEKLREIVELTPAPGD